MTPDTANPDAITREIDLPVPPARAFDGFAWDFAAWWPREHCFCGEAQLDRVFIDLAGGVWGEVLRDGRVIPWGAVVEARPPHRLVLGWQMDATVSPWVPEPDPARASLIDLDFRPTGTGTRLRLVHHGFERQGPVHAAAMRRVMIGLDRWAEWLPLYAASLRPD